MTEVIKRGARGSSELRPTVLNGATAVVILATEQERVNTVAPASRRHGSLCQCSAGVPPARVLVLVLIERRRPQGGCMTRWRTGFIVATISMVALAVVTAGCVSKTTWSTVPSQPSTQATGKPTVLIFAQPG